MSRFAQKVKNELLVPAERRDSEFSNDTKLMYDKYIQKFLWWNENGNSRHIFKIKIGENRGQSSSIVVCVVIVYKINLKFY